MLLTNVFRTRCTIRKVTEVRDISGDRCNVDHRASRSCTQYPECFVNERRDLHSPCVRSPRLHDRRCRVNSRAESPSRINGSCKDGATAAVLLQLRYVVYDPPRRGKCCWLCVTAHISPSSSLINRTTPLREHYAFFLRFNTLSISVGKWFTMKRKRKKERRNDKARISRVL